MSWLQLAMVFLSMATVVPTACAGLRAPVDGAVVRDFEPIGRFAGHWGIDLAVPPGTAVRAAGAGRVTFAGSIAGRVSVTVDHGGGLKTSYSYLQVALVRSGMVVPDTQPIGTSGVDHGIGAVHFSVRLHGAYQDPASWLACQGAPGAGLGLLPSRGIRRSAGRPTPAAYPRSRATRHSRRNIRPASRSPPIRG